MAIARSPQTCASLGEVCSRHRVRRLMKQDGLRALVGYGKRPRAMNGPTGAVAGNVLARAFKAAAPNQSWVTDITYIRTYEGFLYLPVVLDLFSRQIVGWASRSTPHTDLVLQALLAAVVATQTQSGLAAALRSGLPVHQPGLAKLSLKRMASCGA